MGSESLVSISSLVRSDSPRSGGEDEDHVRRLAETDEPLPPILVHWPSMHVVDGMHRLRAARLRGQSVIGVRFLHCGQDEIFVEAVRANVAHGLPLSLADRKAAAGRVLATHPHWSDRMIASATGLAHKTVGRIRRDLAPQLPAVTTRIGRDGYTRPLGHGGRERAAEIVRRDPGASLRAVARAAGVSVGTVHAVRREVRVHGALPAPRPELVPPAPRPELVPPAPRPEPVRRVDEPRVHPPRPVEDAETAVTDGYWLSMMRRLRADPSLRFTEAGRAVLQLFGSHAIAGGGWRRLSDGVPPHLAPSLADMARELASSWQQFAAHLDEVANDPGERPPAT